MIAARLRLNVSLVAALLGLLLLQSGCSGRPADVADVEGVVRLDQQPLPNAMVQMTLTDNSETTYVARTGDDGRFRVMYGREMNGAKVGKYKVRISTHVPGNPEADPPLAEVPESLPPIYSGPDSTLEADVIAGENELTFDLQSQ